MKHEFLTLKECLKYAFMNTCYLDDHTKIYETDNSVEILIGFIANTYTSYDGNKLMYFEWSNEYSVEDYTKGKS